MEKRCANAWGIETGAYGGIPHRHRHAARGARDAIVSRRKRLLWSRRRLKKERQMCGHSRTCACWAICHSERPHLALPHQPATLTFATGFRNTPSASISTFVRRQRDRIGMADRARREGANTVREGRGRKGFTRRCGRIGAAGFSARRRSRSDLAIASAADAHRSRDVMHACAAATATATAIVLEPARPTDRRHTRIASRNAIASEPSARTPRHLITFRQFIGSLDEASVRIVHPESSDLTTNGGIQS